MTIDLDNLEELARAALWTGDWNASCGTVDCAYPADSEFAGEFDEIAHPVPVGVSDYIAAAQPKVALALIAEVRALRTRLEIDPRHPYDGIYCRDETIRQLEGEVRALRAKLSTPIAMGCTYSPIESSMMSGFSRDVAKDVLTREPIKTKSITVYYGEKRIYTCMAEFCAAHPKGQP